jgi:hypothetical protein
MVPFGPFDPFDRLRAGRLMAGRLREGGLSRTEFTESTEVVRWRDGRGRELNAQPRLWRGKHPIYPAIAGRPTSALRGAGMILDWFVCGR